MISITLLLCFFPVAVTVTIRDAQVTAPPRCTINTGRAFLDPEDFTAGLAYLKSKPRCMKGTVHKLYNNSRFEGDISNAMGRAPGARLAVISPAKLWRGGRVPFELSYGFNLTERGRLAAAIIDFDINSCIRFTPRDANIDADYLYIVKGCECWSYVGKLGGRQELSLHEDCLQNHGVIVHEFLHAIGFWHEHSRPDRDGSVAIHWENINESEYYNFDKKQESEVQHFDEPYDFASVMHYTSKAFSINNEPTISALVPGVTLGLTNGFTEGDLRKVNALYTCDDPTVNGEICDESPNFSFSGTKDACIAGHNDAVVSAATLAECKEKCATSCNFECRSVEFLPTANRCNLSKDKQATLVHQSDYSEPCIFPGTVRPMYAEKL